MADCPTCGAADAYIGFNSIECRNKNCEHFKIDEEKTCSCCGGTGHDSVYCPRSLSANYDDSGGNNPKYWESP